MPNERDEQAEAIRMTIRSNYLIQGVRGLFLLNGGGIIALLTFLRTIIDDANSPLPMLIVGGLLAQTMGLAIAGHLSFQIHDTALDFEDGRRAEGYAKSETRDCLVRYSVGFFAVSVILVACGAIKHWQNLCL